ncbi:MAG: ASKHA domain-containing protein [Desulfobaccales bacterium]
MEKQVVFQPSGRRVTAAPEKNLFELALEAGLKLESHCGGMGQCGKCLVRPLGAASPYRPEELELLGEKCLADGYRLACQCFLTLDGTVWVPPESLLHEQVILTVGGEVAMGVDPVVEQFSLTLDPPSLASPISIQGRIRASLVNSGVVAPDDELTIPLSQARLLPDAVNRGQGSLTALLRQGRELVGILPGSGGECLGLAVDMGTTTVVAYLVDLVNGRLLAVEAEMNPQLQRGDDVISRISFCSREPAGLQEMGRMAAESVNRLAKSVCRNAGLSVKQIAECVMVGNTVMHHIFLGLNPSGLALAPYTPILHEPVEVKAVELSLNLAPEAWVHWLPVKAGFVGADTVAVALAVAADRIGDPTLILDLGTNGEMILAQRGRIVCCSTAAGPAFEGAHILHGMRGAAGAVERVSLDAGTLKPKLKVIGGGPPQGICGSGLVSLVSQLLAAGILTPTGSFGPAAPTPYLRSGSQGMEYLLAPAGETDLETDLVLTSKDVAELQLAKGAIRAGVEILMRELGVKQLSRVLLAGAFGNYLDPEEACSLGLFPPVPPERVEGVGNAAGTGAVMALTSRAYRRQAVQLREQMQYIELSGSAPFQDYFIESLPFL